MPKFKYKAKRGPEKIVEGTIEANSLDQAIKKVSDLGLTPIDVSPEETSSPAEDKKTPSIQFSLKKIPSSAITLFTRQICDLVDASVPLLRALELVKKQTKNPSLQEKTYKMYEIVRDGGSFSDALEQFPEVFPKLYVNMVRSGEVSGQLAMVLNRLAELMEKEQETKDKVISSLAYPMFILFVGIVTVFVLLSFVIPRMTVLFEGFDQASPLPTLMLIMLSNMFAKYWLVILAVVAIIVFYFRKFLHTSRGKHWFDSLKLKIPIFGGFIQYVEIGRFARILGTLLESGVVIVTALNSVWAILDNEILKKEIKKVSEEVTNGVSLIKALGNCRYFPEVAINMIAVGEETGYLERGLFKLADTYERQSEQMVKRMISLLGPIVLVIIVSLVGFCVVALLLPILEMNLVVV